MSIMFYPAIILGGQELVGAQQQLRSFMLVHTLSSVVQMLVVVRMN